MERRNSAVGIALLAALLLQGGALMAQTPKNFVSTLLKKYKPPHVITQPPVQALERAALQSAAKRPDIRLSVARLDHALLLHYPLNKRPHSSAFLFKTTYQGREEIWAATAGHNATANEPLLLTFYNGKKAIPVRGTLVQPGPALLSDAALIKLEGPLPADLQPFTLEEDLATIRQPLSTWGYASNKLYHIENLTFEKDNTRFLRTSFPPKQTKRAGLCGGPLLGATGKVLGIHCGSSLFEDKAYAASIRIIPYLLQAYHEGSTEIPLIIQGHVLGLIRIQERITQIRCLDNGHHPLNVYEVYDQLHQSDIFRLLNDPSISFLDFILMDDNNGYPTYRVLTYDKKQRTSYFRKL